MVASDALAVRMAETYLEHRVGAARPLERDGADAASSSVIGGDDGDWFGYSLDHASTI